MAYKYVIYEKDKEEKGIATITLNRPEKLNVMQFLGRGEDAADFYGALEEAASDDDVKVVIIKGAGRAFCAGHDISKVGFLYGMGTGKRGERRPSQKTRLDKDRKGWDDWLYLLTYPKITICQMHGYCVGGGLLLAELCDVAIAAEDAIMGHYDQRMGFAGTSFALALVASQVGMKRAREMSLTGDLMSGTEAERIGLVNKAVPPEELENEVRKMAKKICLQPADGLAMGKASVQMTFYAMGIIPDLMMGYPWHTLFTNLQWQPGEYNFFKHRRDEGLTRAISNRNVRYVDL